MYAVQLWGCVALTFVIFAHSAPTSGSAKETRQQLEQLLLDLQMLLKGVNSDRNSRRSTMLKFKFYMPQNATELKHLQCLAEELKPLEQVLNLSESQNLDLTETKDFVSNINVTVLKLKGSETAFTCEYDEETATIVGFLDRWITFCQSIISKLT